MKYPAVALLALVLAGLPALPAAAEKPMPSLDPKPLVDANNRFACDLYGALRSGPGNRFFSPYSASIALAMARHGAKGETATQIDSVMHFPTERFADLQYFWRDTLEAPLVRDYVDGAWKQIRAYELQSANGYFVQDGFPLERAYTARLQLSHQGRAHRLDFSQSATARAFINGWVQKQTRERIQNLVPPDLPTPDTRLVLANAVYFKASWAESFLERASEDGDFTGREGKVTKARFMRRMKQFRYADLGDAQLVEIPYKGNKMSMVVALPKTKDGLEALEKTLSATSLQDWRTKAKSQMVRLRFPRFKFTVATDLTKVLQGLGMKKPFSPQADFSGMTAAEPLMIGAVLHKAFIAVDEEGTEAAAATAVMMKLGGARPDKPVDFNADHPFLFLIRHNATGTVLFMGRVETPTTP